MIKHATVAVVLLLGLAGCGGSSGPSHAALAQATASAAAAEQAAADQAAAEQAAAEQAAADQAAAQQAQEQAAAAAAAAAAAKKAAAVKAAAARHPATLTARQFALLIKNPDRYVGRFFIIYGEVSQFDSATGDDTFLADSGPTRDPIEYGMTNYTDNTEYTGNPKLLTNVVEGDVFRSEIEVLGSDSYDTQIGGNTTVPKFRIVFIKVYGSTK